jgi:hypothetical protein
MRVLGLAAALLLASAPAATAETVIGRWCDTAWPGGGAEIAIVRADDGALRLSNAFAAGGAVVRPLRLREGTYWAIGEDFGAHYRIGAGGELRIFDNEGFIRSARPGRCRR